MRYAAGCVCSAMLASLFTLWLTQPPTGLSAQEGPALPGSAGSSGLPARPPGPSQSLPPAFSEPAKTEPAPLVPIRPRNADAPRNGSPPSAELRAEEPLRPQSNEPLRPQPAGPMRAEPIIPIGPAGLPTPLPTPRATPLPTPPATPLPNAGAASEPMFRLDDADPELTPEEAVNVAVYENCNRGVVNITSKGLPGERFLFMEVPAEGSGSGAIIDQAGHILTNYHVVENAQQVEVTLFDGSTFDATFVGADPVNDLAVVKIDAPADKLFPIPVGDSSRLKVGMRVFAIGNPFGLERTMTTGIISSLNRSLQIRGNRSIKAIIQIDAAINPGNSGGPLIDSRGRLIGVNTAIATRTGQSSGVGFAIPASLVGRVVPQLLKHGRVIRPEVGIQQVLETTGGLRIAALTTGGPAERAGLRGPQTVRTRRGPFIVDRVDRAAADLIVAVDGEPVETADDFLGLIERKRPGDTVTLRVTRGTQTQDVPIVLAGPPLEAAGPPL